MANSVTHASLPFPVKGARFTVAVPFIDADGDPTDPTTPDTEISKDGGAFADCAEEITTITGSNGAGFITLSGAETDCSIGFLAAKVASGPKATLLTLYPRVLPVLSTGTAQAGANGTITLAADAPAYDLSGCIVKTTGGTGGGGTGGANNQARVITAYDTTTKVATVVPNWETNPSSDTTYEVLYTEVSAAIKRLGAVVDPDAFIASIAAAARDATWNVADSANQVPGSKGARLAQTLIPTDLDSINTQLGGMDESIQGNTNSISALNSTVSAALVKTHINATTTGTPTTTSIACTGEELSQTANAYRDQFLTLNGGGEAQRITAYSWNAGVGTFTTETWSGAIPTATAVIILGKAG